MVVIEDQSFFHIVITVSNFFITETQVQRVNVRLIVDAAVIIVSAMAPLQAALRPLFERFAAGRAGTSR